MTKNIEGGSSFSGRNFKKSLEIVKSIETVADYLGMDFEKVVSRIAWVDEEPREKLNKAIEEHNSFQDMDFKQRGEALGIPLIFHEETAPKNKTQP